MPSHTLSAELFNEFNVEEKPKKASLSESLFNEFNVDTDTSQVSESLFTEFNQEQPLEPPKEPTPEESTLDIVEGAFQASLDFVVGDLKQSGKNLKSGFDLSESAAFNTAANVAMLAERAGQLIHSLPGAPPVDKDNLVKQAEDWLRNQAEERFPTERPTSTVGKISEGIGAVPGTLALLATGTTILGPVKGFAVIEALGAADQGPEATAIAAAKGAALGGILKTVSPLTTPAKVGTLGAVGTGQAVAEGGDVSDAVASGVVFGALGAIGKGGKKTLKGATADAIIDAKLGLRRSKAKTIEEIAEADRLLTERVETGKGDPRDFFRDDIVTETIDAKRQRSSRASEVTKNIDADPLSSAKAKIGAKDAMNESLRTTLTEFRQFVTDDLDGIKKMETKLNGKISDLGPYNTARLTRAAHSMFEGMLKFGRLTVVGPDRFQFKGKGLVKILEPVAERLDDWSLYAVGRSAHELMKQSREKLFTRDEIKALNALETPVFKKAFNEYQVWQKGAVDFAEKLGTINPEQRKLWNRVQYLPFHRAGHKGITKKVDGIAGNLPGIKKLVGSKDNLNDVMENLIGNANRLVTEAIKNDARVKVVDFALNQNKLDPLAKVIDPAPKKPDGSSFLEPIPKRSRAVNIDKKQLEDFTLDAMGIDKIAFKDGLLPKETMETVRAMKARFKEQPEFTKFWQHGITPRGDNVIAIMRKGKAEFYKITDPPLYRAVSAIDRPGRTNPVMKAIVSVKRLGQTTVTLSTDFMIRNFLRDTLMSSIMSKHGFKPIADSWRGMRSRVKEDQNYKDFIANGGGMSSYLVEADAFKINMSQFYKSKGINYDRVVDSTRKFGQFLTKLAEASETAARLGEFKAAERRGVSARKAALEGREVSTDFAMRGDSEILGFLYDTVMFLKPGINGLDRTYRGFTEDINRSSVRTKSMALATFSAGLYLINRNNPDYQERPDWDKDSHWHFYIPDPTGGEDSHFRLPKIWEIGAMASVAERSMGLMLDRNGPEFAKSVYRIMGNQLKLSLNPQVVKPLVDVFGFNENSFTGAPVENVALQGRLPGNRSSSFTNRSLTALGESTITNPPSLQISPVQVEALIRGYFNSWGIFGLAMLDEALFGDELPERRTDELPIAGVFIPSKPIKRTKSEGEFFEMFRESSMTRKTLRDMDAQNKIEIADELADKPANLRYKALMDANVTRREIDNDIKAVRLEKGLTPKERGKKIEALRKEKNEFFHDFIKELKEEEALEEAEKEGIANP